MIVLVILTALYLWSEKKKQELLKKENKRLRLEKSVIEQKMLELMQTLKSLQLNFSQLESNHHAYKYLVPVLMGMQNKLMEELAFFDDNTYDEKLKIIKDYTNQIKVLGAEVNFEFVDDYIKTEITSLKIPSDWVELGVLLEKVMQISKEKDIHVIVFNYVESWDYPVSSSREFKCIYKKLPKNDIIELSKIK